MDTRTGVDRNDIFVVRDVHVACVDLVFGETNDGRRIPIPIWNSMFMLNKSWKMTMVRTKYFNNKQQAEQGAIYLASGA